MYQKLQFSYACVSPLSGEANRLAIWLEFFNLSCLVHHFSNICYTHPRLKSNSTYATVISFVYCAAEDVL